MRRELILALGIVGASALGCGGNDTGKGSGGSGGDATTTPASGGSGGSGGQPTSNSTGGGGTGGSASGGGGSAAACTAMFCDDFEGGTTVDPNLWTLDVGYDPTNLVTIQSDKVAHGQFAAHAHVAAAGGGFAILREKKTFPALAESGWGRAYLFISIPPEAGHTGFISAYIAQDDRRVLEIGESGGNYQLTEYDGTGEQPVGYPTKIPLEKWACVEWHFDRSTAPLIEVYVDGALAVKYDATHMPLDALASFGIGVDNHSTMPSDSDVYIDDVAIDAKRVGCLKE